MYTILDTTTFDPSILPDVAEGLYYDPDVPGFGGGCAPSCPPTSILADWRGYLKDTGVADEEWSRLLFKASANELAALGARLDGKRVPVPPGYESSSLWKVPAPQQKKVRAALQFVELARAVEPLADLTGRPKHPGTLLSDARNALAATKDPFLAQRYAFQILRLLFYQRDWAGAVAFFDLNAAAFATPSTALLFQARYYLAGALARGKHTARSNLELARIHASYPPLAAVAAEEFKPRQDADWTETMRLARDVREKVQLWRIAGVAKDGIAAMQEMLKLDLKSNLYALLMVRELNRAESTGLDLDTGTADPKEVAARKKSFAALAAIAQKLIATPGADSVWLMQLVVGHIAAKQGDLGAARTNLNAALAARPKDPKVASQVRASLAIAHAHDWKFSSEEELARAMSSLDASFARTGSVRTEVRGELSKLYAKAGKIIDAELLRVAEPATPAEEAAYKKRWADVPFLKEMIARTSRTSTEFDRFLLKDAPTRANLERELAARYLVDGDLASAHRMFSTTTATSELLHTDPFVMHVVDCHDCDHETYESAKWTHANVAARLAELEQKARAGGEAGAEAALALGNALYNLTWFGNARVFLAETHAARTRDTRAAERWYKLAFDLSKNRELKARAAFFAAKAELGQLIGEQSYVASLPVPARWYPVVKTMSDTRYYKEILAECGHYKAWAGVPPPRPPVRKHP
ncbi:MAG: hypothetical protein KIT31_20020 [Deltaproteobacteria bacterium]|nr:hypothetical protein [Deltaproteobacteria bacterium]